MTSIPPIASAPPASTPSLDGASKPKKPSAVDEFMAYQKKSIAEKIRDAILKELGLTEEDLKAMTPEQREAVEKKIAERMKEKMKEQIAKNAQESGALTGNVLSLLA